MASRSVRRSPARWLAPVALVAAIVVVGLVVSSSMSDSTSGGGSKASTTATQTTPKSSGPKVTFYTVQSGDVLSVIAEKYGVPVARIEKLNPDIDARTLRPGLRIRLRR